MTLSLSTGEMARRFRETDWAATPLGPIERWPQSLRTAVGICLNSRFPMFVWWGPHLVNVYNDAYLPVLGKRHPEAFGKPAQPIWNEIWHIVGPQADAVMQRGEATWNERVLLVMERNGYAEDTFFTWSYSPIPDEAGAIGGLFCVCTEETQQVRAERERDQLLVDLDGERSRLSEAFQQSPAFLAMLRGRDHVFDFVNEPYMRLIGGRRDVINRPIREALPEITGQGFFELLDRVYETGEPHIGSGTRVLLGRNADQPLEERYVDFVFQPLRNADRSTYGVLVHGIDVTDRRVSEARDKFLVALEEAVRPLTDSAEISATCARLLAEHLQANRCAYADVEADEDTFNLTGDFNRGVPSIIGRYRFADFGDECLRLMRQDVPYVVDDIDVHRPPLNVAAYRSTMIQSVICVPLHKAGRFVAAMAVHQSVPRHWTSDQVELVRHVANRCYESIERARVERELRESEKRFRDAFEHAPIGMTTNDLDGRYLHVNPAYCRIVGFSRDDLLDPAFDARLLSHADDLPVMLALQRKLLAGTIPAFFLEKRYIKKDGQTVWVRVSGTTRRDERGRPFQFIRLVENIDDRKRAERERDELLASERAARAEAERASEAKSEFLATLSHELRTPLTPVLLTASLLERNPGLPDELREDIGLIRRNVELESRLISDLLDLTRIARGKMQLDLQDVELHPLILAAIDICQREASAKLVIDLQANHHAVHGDATRLQQIFWNLVNNAIKFTGADGTVTIRSTDADDGHVRVEVIDTGSGIDPSVLPRLFTAFEQGDVRSIRQQAGLGLGLAISKRLTEAQGGTITARSEGSGHGATFTVELPTIRTSAHAKPSNLAPSPSAMTGMGTIKGTGTMTGSTPPTSPRIRALNVLLVEDHDATLTVMSKLLRGLGHRVAGATSVATAIAAAGQEKFDLIISDLGLPDGSGLDVMRALRNDYDGRAIALTGYGMDTDIAASLEAGFSDHLTKPVDFDQLQRAIARVLGAPSPIP